MNVYVYVFVYTKGGNGGGTNGSSGVERSRREDLKLTIGIFRIFGYWNVEMFCRIVFHSFIYAVFFVRIWGLMLGALLKKICVWYYNSMGG